MTRCAIFNILDVKTPNVIHSAEILQNNPYGNILGGNMIQYQYLIINIDPNILIDRSKDLILNTLFTTGYIFSKRHSGRWGEPLKGVYIIRYIY